ncbi:MAG: exodeoxyribonuclease VII large subunit [Bacteroidales bacterium]
MSSGNSLSLSQLNTLVKSALNECFVQSIWLRAELSDVKSYQSGHCYFEFIEKDESGQTIIAKAPGRIWAQVFRTLRPYFEKETGQLFMSGIKVLVRVTIDFHPLYGFSLNVLEIDPSFTLGDLVKKRRDILAQLEKEGLMELNKKKMLSLSPQRVAVISSESAAGFEDFMNQLNNNPDQYKFYVKLFPALMQGIQVEESMLNAFRRIEANKDFFDVVVIIRGGGSASDLNCFDNYLLGAAVANCSLPVITGIGHERDTSVLDEVAYMRVKTPTAAAEFLIKTLQNAEMALLSEIDFLKREINERIEREKQKLLQWQWYIPQSVRQLIHSERAGLERFGVRIETSSRSLIQRETQRCNVYKEQLKSALINTLSKKSQDLTLKEKIVELSSPHHIMEKGYVFVTQNDLLIKNAGSFDMQKEATIHFIDKDITINNQPK